MNKYDKDYNYDLKLFHHERPAKKDMRTGEFKEVGTKKFVSGARKYDLMPVFRRSSDYGWDYVADNTTPLEFKCASTLSRMAKANSNSLHPLKDDVSIRVLADDLGIGKSAVKKTVDKLFKLGVIGKFLVEEYNVEYGEYWIFNPYLSFNGVYIDTSIKELFSKTTIAMIVTGEIQYKNKND